MTSNPQQRLARLREQFLERTAAEMAVLHDALKLLQQGDDTAAEQIELLAHRIHGTGATLGFDLISHCANQVESLAALLRQQHSRDAWPLEQLAASVDRLAAEVQDARALRYAC